MAKDLIEIVKESKSLKSIQEQAIFLHKAGFNNAEITNITGGTRNSIDWYVSRYRTHSQHDSQRAAFALDKKLTEIHLRLRGESKSKPISNVV